MDELERLEAPPGKRLVSMSDALARAGHGLTLSEIRLIRLAISKLDSRKQPRPGETPSTRISAAEYAEAYEVDSDTAYNQLKSGANQLYERSITFYEPPTNKRTKTPTTVRMRWVGSVKYQRGEGWVELWWWPQLYPHLMGLRKRFISYQLQQASALRSGASWRLLELLTQYERTGWLEMDIEAFGIAMDATEKQRADFAKLRTRYIEPAVKELREKDGWLIDWKALKSGRRVRAVRFDFKRDEQLRLDFDGQRGG